MNPAFSAIILSLFPEMFPGPLGHSLAGTALKNCLWSLDAINIRDFAIDKHRTVDDSPYGGGTGMVLKPDVVDAAVEHAKSKLVSPTLIYTSPRGKPFTQSMAEDFKSKNLIILCGRFEGVDQRVIDYHDMTEVSIGDYVLSGGEIAAMAILDACVRLLPGVIGKEDAITQESFSIQSNSLAADRPALPVRRSLGEGGSKVSYKNQQIFTDIFENYAGLLEYPHYTRPSSWKGLAVPDVLLSGNHGQINAWRLEQAKTITQARRPDLMKRLEKRNKK